MIGMICALVFSFFCQTVMDDAARALIPIVAPSTKTNLPAGLAKEGSADGNGQGAERGIGASL